MAKMTKQAMIEKLQAEVEALKAALATNQPKSDRAKAVAVTDFVKKIDWNLDEVQLAWLMEREKQGDLLVTSYNGKIAMSFQKGWMAKGQKNAQAANRVLVLARKAATKKFVSNGFNRDHAWFAL